MAYLRVPTPSPAGRTDRRLEYRLTTVSPIDSAFRLSLSLSPSCAARSFRILGLLMHVGRSHPRLLRRPKPSPFRRYYRPSPFLRSFSLARISLRSPGYALRRCNSQPSRSDVLYPPAKRCFARPSFSAYCGQTSALGPFILSVFSASL